MKVLWASVKCSDLVEWRWRSRKSSFLIKKRNPLDYVDARALWSLTTIGSQDSKKHLYFDSSHEYQVPGPFHWVRSYMSAEIHYSFCPSLYTWQRQRVYKLMQTENVEAEWRRVIYQSVNANISNFIYNNTKHGRLVLILSIVSRSELICSELRQ